jgi:putative oxidoreductase
MGCANIYNWQVAEIDVARVVSSWQGYTGFAITMIPLLMGLGVALQIAGGLLLFLGFRVRLGAALLLAYLLPVTVIYHPFWFLTAQDQSFALILFLKNLAIIGGLIVVLALGKGCDQSPSLSTLND